MSDTTFRLPYDTACPVGEIQVYAKVFCDDLEPAGIIIPADFLHEYLNLNLTPQIGVEYDLKVSFVEMTENAYYNLPEYDGI